MNPLATNQIGDSQQASANALENLPAIIRIGVESELSKYPVHNLAQRGSINIEIRETNDRGVLLVKWEVSYNNRYGRPGPLAYKADTIVVNRRIDEARGMDDSGNPIPIPEILPVGSLSEIATMLNLGGDTNSVKRALRQNVGIMISAKIKQRTVDGTERTLEADFSRYGVVFTGEKLPDGKKADCVYLVLNKLYRDILNSAPIQPQNWAHRELPASSHRFYVLLSNRMYATLGSNNPEAKISYSYFCQRAPLTRHHDYQKFKSQMYKIQKPLKEVGYIKSARWEEKRDAAGNIVDWMMCYTPGPLAKAEYNQFNPTKKQLPISSDEVGQGVFLHKPRTGPRQRRLKLAAAPKEKSIDAQLLVELASRGVGESDARKLLASLPADQPVLLQLEWGDFQIAQQPGKITNPPGFYISLLQRNIPVPAMFQSSAVRKAQEAAILRQREAIQEAQAVAILREQQEAARADAELDQVQASNPERYNALFGRAKADLLSQFPHMAAIFKTHPDSPMHDGAIRARMKQMLKLEPQPATNPDPGQSGPFSPELAPAMPALNLETILTTLQLAAPKAPAQTEPEESPIGSHLL